jgi:hypothetical protein
MTCEEAKILLPEYWRQTLGEKDELAFESHIDTCDNCRAETERLGVLWKGLALLPVEEPSANLRTRFYESLGAFRQGLAAAPAPPSLRDRILALWPKQPAWQMGVSFALLVVGLGVGYGIRPEQQAQLQPGAAQPASEVAQLRGEVNTMRQMVALSLLQQQSASERLRGVSWAYKAQPSDTEVLSALLTAVNQDPNVNVRIDAVGALRAFGSSPMMRTAIVQSISKQTTPMVQIALIDLLVDLKEKEAVPELRNLAADEKVNEAVRQHANWALGKLK